MTRNQPRYSVWINDQEMGIYVMRDAGICGPGSMTKRPATVADADTWLGGQGFVRSSEWKITSNYSGHMGLDADLVKL